MALAKLKEESGLSSALIHGTTYQSRYIPAVLDWIEKLSGDVKSQLRANKAGVISDVERRRQYNDNAKMAAARKRDTTKAKQKKAD